MTFAELAARAAEYYCPDSPDMNLMQYVDQQRDRPVENPSTADTLGLFIVRELYNTFDPELDDDAQLAEALGALVDAWRDLGDVIGGLDEDTSV